MDGYRPRMFLIMEGVGEMADIDKSFLGIMCMTDTTRDIHHYQLGVEKYMPISLFLSLCSSYDLAFHRLLNTVVASYTAKQVGHEFKKSALKPLIERFNSAGDLPESQCFDGDGNPLVWISVQFADTKPDYEQIVPLQYYLTMWDRFLNMATPHYDLSEHRVLETPIGWMQFINRQEFHKPYEEAFNTLRHIVLDVQRLMMVRGFEVNDHNHTFLYPDYHPIRFEESFGF